MTQTTYTDNVKIDGSQDITQLEVEGHSTQDTPLQTWKNSAGDTLAEVTGDGRLLVGDASDVGTPDTLIEAHLDGASSSVPQHKRGLQVSGELVDETETNITWSVHEVELSGSSTTTAQATALRAGVVTDGADLDTAVGIEVQIDKESTGTITEAVGLEVTDINQATNNFAIRTGKGLVQLGDTLELTEPTSVPGTPGADIIRLYPKSDDRLYAKNPNGDEIGIMRKLTVDTHTNRPSSNNSAGDIFLPEDAPGLERYDGTDWEVWGPLSKFTPPDVNDFTWVNQGSATAVQTGSTLHLQVPGQGTASARIFKKATPSTPYTITVRMDYLVWEASAYQIGLIWRESSSGKFVVFTVANSGTYGYSLVLSRWNSVNSWNSNFQGKTAPMQIPWWRIEDDGTNRKSYISLDGQNWILFNSISRTDWITPDEVGFFLQSQQVSGSDYNDIAMHVMSWEEA